MTIKERSKAPRLGGSGEMFDEGGDRGGPALATVRCVLLLVAGLLTGAIFEVWLGEHSFRGSGSLYTELKQLQIRALQGPLPALGAATLAFGLAHLFLARGSRLATASTLAGIVCFAVCFVITVRGHFPINAQIMGWSAATPPDGWSRVAAEWRQLHALRTLFAVLGYGFLTLGVVLPFGRRGGSAGKWAGRGTG